jgi:pimeloyl-ACP methyl ester carboxylesterase
VNEARYREAERRLWESVGVAPSERQLALGRTGVTVRVLEMGAGPPVVFMHGLSNSGVSWAPLIARLDGFRCLLLDRPGCGLSDPLPYTLDDPERLGAYGDALIVDVIDALGLERASVVATSFGGYFALRGAAAHPDRIDRVVEFGWTVGAPIGSVPLMIRIGGIPVFGRLAGLVPPNERAVRIMLRSIGLRGALESGRFSQQMLDTYLSLLRDTDTTRNELKAGPHTFRLRGFNKSVFLREDLLRTIRTPTYFLWGEDDPMGGAETARRFVSRIPGAEIEMMPGAGHAVWVDDPDHVGATTRRFLSASSSSAPLTSEPRRSA